MISGDALADDALTREVLAPAFKLAVRHCRPSAGWYIWHASQSRAAYDWAMTAAGLVELQLLIWAKPCGTLCRQAYHQAHELCFYAGRSGEKIAFYGDRKQTTLWRVGLAAGNEAAATLGPGICVLDGAGGMLWIQSQVPKGRRPRKVRLDEGQVLRLEPDRHDSDVWEISRETGYEHPNQKPVELPARAIRNSSEAGEVVLDPFLGSGSSLIAAEKLDRRCFGLELNPVYCDVIVRRWERFVGKAAILEGEGAVFADVATARREEFDEARP